MLGPSMMYVGAPASIMYCGHVKQHSASVRAAKIAFALAVSGVAVIVLLMVALVLASLWV